MSSIKLDPNKMPTEIIELVPLAEKWGIGDDYDREQAINNAPLSELEQLATCLDKINADSLFKWLSGPESYSERPSEEYIAFTNLTMAIDSAKVKIKRK